MDSLMRRNTNISSSKDCFIWKIVNFSKYKELYFYGMKGHLFRVESTFKSPRRPWKINFSVNVHSENDSVALWWMIDIASTLGHLIHSSGVIRRDGSVIPLQLTRNERYPGAIIWFYNIKKDKLEDKSLSFPDGSLILKLDLLDSQLDYRTLNFVESTFSVDKIYFNYFIESLLSLTLLYITFECPVRLKFEMFLFKCRDDIRIELKNVQDPAKFLMKTTIKVTLFDINGCEIYSGWHKFLLTKDQFLYELQPSIPISLISERKSKDRKVAFNFLCQFHVVKLFKECVIKANSIPLLLPVCYHFKNCHKLNDMQKDLFCLFMGAILYDIKLQAGDTIFPVHRIILSVRSPVFREMLENRDLKFIDIPDVEVLILEKFLKFLYFGTVEPLDYETAFKLLFLSNRYQVKSLKDKCLFFLKKISSEKHISDIFVV